MMSLLMVASMAIALASGCGVETDAELDFQDGLQRGQAELESEMVFVPLPRIYDWEGHPAAGILLDESPEIVAVHRTPGGGCALGSGPIGSPRAANAVEADIDSCHDFCGGDGTSTGARAVPDGTGGCKLECRCAGSGDWSTPPPIVVPELPRSPLARRGTGWRDARDMVSMARTMGSWHAAGMVDAALEQRIQACLDAEDAEGAVTAALMGYGPRILGYQRAVLRDAALAEDAFSLFSEFVWTGISRFRGDASFLTWAYTLAWSAVQRCLRDPFRRRGQRLATHSMDKLVAEAHSSASLFIRQQAPAHLDALRATLEPEEQTLLILRIDRGLGWREVAQIMGVPPERGPVAALRKRFERLKKRLREDAAATGRLRE